MLSKTNTFNFYRKKSLNKKKIDEIFFFKGLWIKFCSRKLFLGLISIQYLNILQFIKTVVDTMCVLFYKKIKKWLQKHLSWKWQKNNKIFCQKKFFRVFKGAIFGRWCFSVLIDWEKEKWRKSILHHWKILYTFHFLKQTMHKTTTLFPPSKQRLHKLCFLQKLGCQKPCGDQARLSSQAK